tara:strand:+ start:1606 stop:2586 length:981 start_codon:yes stop_codon:yes gene_type:complete
MNLELNSRQSKDINLDLFLSEQTCKLKLDSDEETNENLKLEISNLNKVILNLKTINDNLRIENNKLKLSNSRSNTAKNGYKEEELVCQDLNTNEVLRKKLNDKFDLNFDICSKIEGTSKTDISSKDKKMMCQVKKFKIGQFQQLDRHWTKDLFNYLENNLKEEEDGTIFKNILNDLCERPLNSEGTHIDKDKDRVLISDKYSKDEVNKFIKLMNKNKRKILEYAFYGTDNSKKPTYLIGVKYIKKENEKKEEELLRSKLIIFKVEDIINHLIKLSFVFKGTVIKLGEILTLQRKGGDNGKKSSNQLQFKIIVSSINIDNHLEYNLS